MSRGFGKTDKRFKVWLHNSFLGHAAMMRQQARDIQSSETASTYARLLAAQIEDFAFKLDRELRANRIDPL